jgi:ribosome biogenesis GTPase
VQDQYAESRHVGRTSARPQQPKCQPAKSEFSHCRNTGVPGIGGEVVAARPVGTAVASESDTITACETAVVTANRPAAEDCAKQVGTVIRSGPGHYLVRAGENTGSCRLKKKLTMAKQRVTSLVCVGDRVTLDRLAASHCPQSVAGVEVAGTGIIAEILPRVTALTRLSPPDMPGRAPLQQVLAANVDLGVIVVAALSPALRMGAIERYLIMCRQAGIEPLVCINKMDQAETDENLRELHTIKKTLEGRGERVLLTSAETDFGVSGLKSALAGTIAVFMGPSGVGKTSLLNRMCPNLDAKTLTISTATNKGRHSTTTASLIDVGGGYVADLPGLRTLGFWQLEEEVVRSEYEDIEEIGLGCKFSDCSHTHEPGCAVKAAVKLGNLDEERYRRYVKVMRETTKKISKSRG